MNIIAILIILLPGFSYAQLLLEPSERSFYEHKFGSYLEMSSNDIKNEIIFGSGHNFESTQRNLYNKIKRSEQGNYQWVLRYLDTKTVVSSSNPNKQFYGASVSKIFVAAAYLDSVAGQPSLEAIEHLNKLIVVSSNISWSALQTLLGKGDENLGRAKVDSFLKRIGITRSIGFRGYLDGVHGNEVNATDIANFMQNSYDQLFQGSKHLFQLMHLSRTGKLRGKKYISNQIYIGGKTGSYTGRTSVNGLAIKSQSKHHTMVFSKNSFNYSLTILSDPGTNEDIAVLAAGLIEDL